MGRQNQVKNYQRKGSVTDWELADQAVGRRALDAGVAEYRSPISPCKTPSMDP